MKVYVGITDKDWYEMLMNEGCDEVNFWKPGSQQSFKALEENELFLFKLHSPDNYIVGGGFFVRYSVLPTFLAWNAFERKNGTESFYELDAKITMYRKRNHMPTENPQIGCIILTEPFWFDKSEWIPVPDDWGSGIMQGKTYDSEIGNGKKLYKDVIERIQKMPSAVHPKFTESMTKHRIGQGAFRVLVTDAYQRRCAISGEKTLPVLEAAHIMPYSQLGTHNVQNGLLLRSDLHTLFDKGYLTIDKNYTIDVSKRLHDDFGNGRDYYKYHGNKLLVLPSNIYELPDKQYLEWHNEKVFLG